MQNCRIKSDRRTIAIVASLMLWAAPVVSTEENIVMTEPFTQYTAKYSVMKSGATLAEAVFTLSSSEQGWLYRSHARPRGFATLFTSDEIAESSVFDLHEGSVRPLHYQYEQGAPRGKSKKILRAQYDWQARNVTIDNGKESTQIPINSNTHDPLSVQLALMQRMKRGCKFAEYSVIDDMELEQRNFERSGDESIRTAAGNHDTIRVIYRSGKRETISWLAPALHYIPVKVQQLKDGKLKSEMQLQSVIFDEPAVIDR